MFFSRSFLVGSALVSSLVLGGFSVKAQEMSPTPPVFLSCVPPAQVSPERTFPLIPGKATVFSCLAQNTKTDTYPALLLGKQIGPDGSSTASANNFTLKGEGDSGKLTLEFPPVFHTGQYSYTFSLTNTTTQEPLTHDVLFFGNILEAQQARIASATLDKEQFSWGETTTLKLTLTLPEGVPLEADPFRSDVAMLDQFGYPCATLLADKELIGKENSLSFTFPNEDTACANSLTISLKKKDGTVIDQKILAVSLPEKQVPAASMDADGLNKTTALIVFAIIGTSVLLGGYLWLRRRG